MVACAAMGAAGVASFGICGVAKAQEKRAITLDDFAKTVSISSAAISHDGTRIATVISRVNMKDDGMKRSSWLT